MIDILKMIITDSDCDVSRDDEFHKEVRYGGDSLSTIDHFEVSLDLKATHIMVHLKHYITTGHYSCLVKLRGVIV